MRLIHITDPHLSSLDGHSLLSLRGKRLTGYLSWTRNRRFFHRREVLDRLVAGVQTESADQIIVSGDLVQIGLEDEIRQAGDWLAELAPANRIFLVPGNHDVYAHDSWAAIRKYWNSFLPAIPSGSMDGPDSGYPMVRDFGGLRVIGASSACVRPVFSARGATGPKQFERLNHLLRESREQDFFSCLVIHHPPLPGMAKWRKALKEVKSFQSLIATRQPALVLYGHLHHNLERHEGASRIYCTASASNEQDASYRVFDIEPENAGWNVRMQLKSIIGGADLPSARLEVIDDQHWSFTGPSVPA